MAKKKKILKDCPLGDKKCNDCEQQKACKEIVAKNKKSILSKLREILTI
ncbi:MAG: hypothetical protein NT116_01795 [Candidatus Parcubacteria bacterium]|nr:hypothetical protein [Candidatus Parcubacteria bacterium]